MNWLTQERWERLWQCAGAQTAPSRSYQIITDAYDEPQRHYHNQQHIAECLAEFDLVRHLTRQPAAVELALWLHDAVYDPRRGDNEEMSASLAKLWLELSGLEKSVATTVIALVMATKKHEVSGDSDAALVVDVDLSILGKDERRFLEYENQIREEYAWVPQETFASKRAEILRRFLERSRIYHSDWFFNKYEQQARRNLAASIANLEQPGAGN